MNKFWMLFCGILDGTFLKGWLNPDNWGRSAGRRI